MNRKVLLISEPEHDEVAVEWALDLARHCSCTLVVIQILDSRLYHYGRNDVVVPSYARTQFLYHVHEELLRQGEEREAALKRKAAEIGVGVEILSVESDDARDFVIPEAQKGYRYIFLPKVKRKWFPLFGNATIEETLRKKGVHNIISY